MNTITKEYYNTVMRQHAEIVDLVLERATTMALIQYGRHPIGTCGETDFDEEDGKLLVQFEEYWCGESNYDTYRVPIEYLFDPDWVEKYEVFLVEDAKRREEEKIQRKKRERVYHVVENTEEWDLQEYERLKAKYGGI